MIERFYLKDYLSFQEAELNLKHGLVVFSGPSGSGKSILIESILASVGLGSCDANICESSVTWDINEEETGLENDEINVFKHIKKEKSRYFINNQSISRKSINSLTSKYLKHLSLRDFSDFDNDGLLSILDNKIGKEAIELKSNLKQMFQEYSKVKKELEALEDEEKRIVELKEFAKFEIDRINMVNPKVGEDEELLEIKKELSKKEKALELIAGAVQIFNLEHSVSSVLDTLDVDSAFFDDAMNELRSVLETAQEKFSALDEVEVEEILNRIEELAELKRRYGSIENAIEYKIQKLQELEKYENIEVEKGELQKRYEQLAKEVTILADNFTSMRLKALPNFEKELNNYLKQLYLRDAKVVLSRRELTSFGQDALEISLNDTALAKISTGEFNRLRLAVLALKSESLQNVGGVLMLDEIDANLSGEESMSVAKVLKKLTKNFQIFVISHQPQLTSMGDQHFLVYKDGTISKTKELSFSEKIDEIARIISGDTISDEAKKFARELLEANR